MGGFWTRRGKAAAIVAALFVAAVVAADLAFVPGDMTQAELRQALAGNTVIGNWSGRAFVQYFDADGWTEFLADDRTPTRGRWQATDGDRLCAAMPPTWNTDCFTVWREDDMLVWQGPGTAQPKLTKLLAGNHLELLAAAQKLEGGE